MDDTLDSGCWGFFARTTLKCLLVVEQRTRRNSLRERKACATHVVCL